MTENQITQPPDDSMVPWTPRQARRHLEMLAEHVPADATPEQALNIAATMLDYMACPHPECPRLLLEHHQHEQGGA